MDSYPNYNPEDERSYPAAPKGGSGPEGVPLGPDHNPQSGGYAPNDDNWAGGTAFPLSSPYTGMSSGEPPAPIFRPEIDGPGVARGGFPSRTDVGARSRPTNRRRVLAGLAAFLVLVLVVGGLAFVLLGGDTGSGHPTANGGNTNGGGAPVIVGTDTPTPTPTLLPGQTPLPTAVPATPTPVLAPGQPTPTPLPYASSASVSFTRATQGYSVSSTLTAATSGGDIAATPENGNVNQNPSAPIGANFDPGSQVIFNLTVSNNSGTDQFSPVGRSIQSVDGKVTCNIAGTQGQTVPAHSSIQQPCAEAAQTEPAETWNDSTYNPLAYSGSSSKGGSPPFWYVPNTCTSDNQTAADNAAKSALQGQLDNQTPGGSVVFPGGPTFNIDNSSLTCAPVAGTQQNSSFTFVVKVNGSASQTSYKPGDAIAFQQNRVKNSVGAGYQYVSANVCSSPSLSNVSPTSATVTCSASGTEAWNTFNLAGMATLIHGQTQGTAKSELDAVQGVVGGSETFSLSGGSYLPTNASNISFHYSP